MGNNGYRRVGGGFRALAGLVCVLVFAAGCPRAAAKADPLLNKPAPSFVRNDLDNNRIDFAALRGRAVLLNFWATWCAPCQIEMPRFAQWQTRYKAEGLEIIGISMDDDPAPVQSLLRNIKVNYPIVMGDEKLGLQFGGVLGLPVSYLIDRKGIVRAHYKGEADLNRMEADIQKLLNSR
jgi:cytochrome c biogenesis protein CcmG, thiol:disulfide interchange protein DsbE